MPFRLGAKLCPGICPRVHRFQPNAAELLGLSRHESAANNFLEPILSRKPGFESP